MHDSANQRLQCLCCVDDLMRANVGPPCSRLVEPVALTRQRVRSCPPLARGGACSGDEQDEVSVYQASPRGLRRAAVVRWTRGTQECVTKVLRRDNNILVACYVATLRK